jgi:hypothetical protein
MLADCSLFLIPPPLLRGEGGQPNVGRVGASCVRVKHPHPDLPAQERGRDFVAVSQNKMRP